MFGEDLSIDFVTHLPNSFGDTTIWVICDRLIKFAYFLALPSHLSTTDCAAHFFTGIFHLHVGTKINSIRKIPYFLK